ncbi:MAG: kinase/pyrophosphorylase [Deltaproteobacteria bacterium]|jgi:regulator of PEP synthase PpsR (kinase-PPPase family)|nr:MAG: kinase/pyrophosphorylase [Deltaproteobacteria bacterium]
MTDKKKIIYLVGEGTGETVTKLANAALSQFTPNSTQVRLFTMVEDTARILSILSGARRERAIIAYTIVDAQNRDFLEREAAKRGVEVIDVMGSFIIKLALFLEQKPLGIPGKQHQADASYYRRIEAIEFTVKHDDGQAPHTMNKADLVLVGLSRTSKTPLSSYMAQMGWKVANVPLFPDITPPGEIFTVDQVKIYGLIIEPEALVRVRRERLKYLGLPDHAKYADRDKIEREIRWCRAFYRKHPQWPVVDVSGKAIEETAAKVMQLHQARLEARERAALQRAGQRSRRGE